MAGKQTITIPYDTPDGNSIPITITLPAERIKVDPATNKAIWIDEDYADKALQQALELRYPSQVGKPPRVNQPGRLNYSKSRGGMQGDPRDASDWETQYPVFSKIAGALGFPVSNMVNRQVSSPEFTEQNTAPEDIAWKRGTQGLGDTIGNAFDLISAPGLIKGVRNFKDLWPVAKSVAGYEAASRGTEAVADKLGVDPTISRLLGQATGIGGATVAAGGSPRINDALKRGKIEAGNAPVNSRAVQIGTGLGTTAGALASKKLNVPAYAGMPAGAAVGAATGGAISKIPAFVRGASQATGPWIDPAITGFFKHEPPVPQGTPFVPGQYPGPAVAAEYFGDYPRELPPYTTEFTRPHAEQAAQAQPNVPPQRTIEAQAPAQQAQPGQPAYDFTQQPIPPEPANLPSVVPPGTQWQFGRPIPSAGVTMPPLGIEGGEQRLLPERGTPISMPAGHPQVSEPGVNITPPGAIELGPIVEPVAQAPEVQPQPQPQVQQPVIQPTVQQQAAPAKPQPIKPPVQVNPPKPKQTQATTTTEKVEPVKQEPAKQTEQQQATETTVEEQPKDSEEVLALARKLTNEGRQPEDALRFARVSVKRQAALAEKMKSGADQQTEVTPTIEETKTDLTPRTEAVKDVPDSKILDYVKKRPTGVTVGDIQGEFGLTAEQATAKLDSLKDGKSLHRVVSRYKFGEGPVTQQTKQTGSAQTEQTQTTEKTEKVEKVEKNRVKSPDQLEFEKLDKKDKNGVLTDEEEARWMQLSEKLAAEKRTGKNKGTETVSTSKSNITVEPPNKPTKQETVTVTSPATDKKIAGLKTVYRRLADLDPDKMSDMQTQRLTELTDVLYKGGKERSAHEIEAKLAELETKKANSQIRSRTQENQPKESKTSSSPIDHVVSTIDESWSPGETITRKHVVDLAKELGTQQGPLARFLMKKGYTVEPSLQKAGWGVERPTKGGVGGEFDDKIMERKYDQLVKSGKIKLAK